MTQTVLDRPDHTTGLTPTGVGVDHRGIERPRRSLRPPRIAIDWSSGPSATVLLLLLGMGLGPHGLAFLTPQILSFLDSAAPVAMPREERRARMRALRRVVAGRNVFSWASDILEGLESLWTRPLHYAVRGWEDTSV